MAKLRKANQRAKQRLRTGAHIATLGIKTCKNKHCSISDTTRHNLCEAHKLQYLMNLKTKQYNTYHLGYGKPRMRCCGTTYGSAIHSVCRGFSYNEDGIIICKNCEERRNCCGCNSNTDFYNTVIKYFVNKIECPDMHYPDDDCDLCEHLDEDVEHIVYGNKNGGIVKNLILQYPQLEKRKGTPLVKDVRKESLIGKECMICYGGINNGAYLFKGYLYACKKCAYLWQQNSSEDCVKVEC